jgi:hypothetical protein
MSGTDGWTDGQFVSFVIAIHGVTPLRHEQSVARGANKMNEMHDDVIVVDE